MNATTAFAKAFTAATDETMHSLIGEQLTVENTLHDNPNYYTSYDDVDLIIDIFLHRHDCDGDNDGVHDWDKDNDGLPDSIVSGLDLLKQMLDGIKNGHYSGRWDVDGDGIENSLDNVDVRASITRETCTDSDNVACTKA